MQAMRKCRRLRACGGRPCLQVRAKLYSSEVAALQFNVLVTTFEYIMRDRSRLSKVLPHHLFPTAPPSQLYTLRLSSLRLSSRGSAIRSCLRQLPRTQIGKHHEGPESPLQGSPSSSPPLGHALFTKRGVHDATQHQDNCQTCDRPNNARGTALASISFYLIISPNHWSTQPVVNASFIKPRVHGSILPSNNCKKCQLEKQLIRAAVAPPRFPLDTHP